MPGTGMSESTENWGFRDEMSQGFVTQGHVTDQLAKNAQAASLRPPMKYTIQMSTVGRRQSMGRSARDLAR